MSPSDAARLGALHLRNFARGIDFELVLGALSWAVLVFAVIVADIR